MQEFVGMGWLSEEIEVKDKAEDGVCFDGIEMRMCDGGGWDWKWGEEREVKMRLRNKMEIEKGMFYKEG